MSKLQEIYIKKYISSKDFNIIQRAAVNNFEEEYGTDHFIINKELDLILYMMSKSDFLGLIRNTVILFNSLNPTKKIRYDDENSLLLTKRDVVDLYLDHDNSFLLYLTTALYLHI